MHSGTFEGGARGSSIQLCILVFRQVRYVYKGVWESAHFGSLNSVHVVARVCKINDISNIIYYL